MRYLFSVVMVSIVVLAALLSLRFTTSHLFAPTEAGVHGAEVNAPIDILFIGSSHTRQSYDARLIEQKTGKKVFLIAYNGLDPVGMVPVIREVLSQGMRPKVLVVEAYGAVLGRPHQVQDSRLFFDAGPRLKKELLAEFTRSPRTLEKLLDAFALLANRNNEAIVAYPLNRLVLRNVSYHGAYDDKFVPGLSEEQFRKLRIPMSGAIDIDPEQRAAVKEIMRLARAAGVKILFAESPLPGPTAASSTIRGLKQQTRALFAEEGVEYMDGEGSFPIGDPSLFADSNHLSTKGRAVFSQRTAEWLAYHAIATEAFLD